MATKKTTDVKKSATTKPTKKSAAKKKGSAVAEGQAWEREESVPCAPDESK